MLDRRGGVDLILGGPSSRYVDLAEAGYVGGVVPPGSAPWHTIARPDVPPGPQPDRTLLRGDPRDDPSAFVRARSRLEPDWHRGFEALVRLSAWAERTSADGPSPMSTGSECLALAGSGPSTRRAKRLLLVLDTQGHIAHPPRAAVEEALADGLLADLLGSALVDALAELRAAGAALRQFGHPARAEASIGASPPWPPESVLRLRASPGGEILLETLAEQVAPDPEARAWLVESWSRPKRPIDGALLLELARAADGRLAREPRFRAWLRGEWTAWMRQLYRRVARLAGGYNPS